MKDITRAVAYIRVSTDKQANEGYSLEGQEEEIKQYCKINNIELLKIFKDEGISGKSIEGRDAFQEMLSFSIKSNINKIIAFKLSRFTRKVSDLTSTMDLLDKNGISISFIKDGIDTETHMGKFMSYIIGAVSEMERSNIIDFVTMGMETRAKSGLWNGGRVFGYTLDENKELEINKSEAELIINIFNHFAIDNWGFKKIANYLNKMGMGTMRNTSWSVQSIKQIIDNPIYVGIIRWGKYRDWNKKKRKGKSEEYIMVEGKHQPIISKDIWEKTQQIRSVTGIKNEKIYEGNYLLTGLLKCPVCGASMVSHRSKMRNGEGYHRYYQCSVFANKGASICRSNIVNADVAEAIILKKIIEIVNNPEIVKIILEKSEIKNKVNTEPLLQELQKIEKELKKIDKSKKENFKSQLDGLIDIRVLNEFNSFLNEQEKDLLSKNNIINEELRQISNPLDIDETNIQAILSNFNSIFDKANIVQKKQLLKSIISKISVKEGKNPSERIISQIEFCFMPQEIGALTTISCFPPTYDTVPPSLS